MTHRRHSRRLITPRSYETMPATRLHLLGGNSLNISRTLLKPIQLDTITGKPHKRFNMMTPRRLEAITPKTIRSFPKLRPKTCLPRLQCSGSRPPSGCFHKPPETHDLSRLKPSTPQSASGTSVLDRILCSGKTASIVPRKAGGRKARTLSSVNEKGSTRRRRSSSVHRRHRATTTTRGIRASQTPSAPMLEPEDPVFEYNLQPVTAVAAGLMSEEQILDMMTREITPEDFEMLLLLDETNDKKYKTVQKDVFERFDRVPAPKDKNYECRVCLEPVCDILEGEQMCTRVPCCQRVFHQDCIKKWLTEYSKTCPSCRVSLE
eukprot:g9163.t1